VIAFDPASGLSVSGTTLQQALADLARLIAAQPARAPGDAQRQTGLSPPVG